MVREHLDDDRPTGSAVTNVGTAEARLAEVVAATWPVLVDFDGPVTHLFVDGRNRRLTDRLRAVLIKAGVPLPDELATTVDPLAVLRWSALHAEPPVARAVEMACVAGEYDCVAESKPTPGAAELLSTCHEVGRPTLIVSNNAEGPIQRFLEEHQLDHLVQAIIGRVAGHPELMKPHPNSIQRALDHLGTAASDCAFIGDSVSDIAVAHLTGVRSIGQAKNPRRGQELAAAGADTLVADLHDLAHAIARRGAVRPRALDQ